ncbi:MAG: hypothetical protein ABIY71_10155, partial [Flavobacteriales bacterium]
MEADKCQRRVRKDAAFQRPDRPNCITTGEHNGQAPVLLPEFMYQSLKFHQGTMVDASGQTGDCIRPEKTGIFRRIHFRQSGTVRM